ncbi:MAG TPA: murein biosynthesis integral membrane protein MurJ [Acidimicrobiales bacterium]|nr:murein biosynthesis integral membrane protein MurJ [Acidimicrobiales bacterium]
MPAARRARALPLRTAAVYVAFGTGVSRVTGLLRFVALAWALGQTFLADSYNLANTTPNMLYDVVLGGVLSATFIPVFVDRLSNRSEPEAFESISAVVSVSVVVLFTTTVAALIAAPYIIDALTSLDTHATAAQAHRVALERGVATTLLRWFVIQIAAYGLFALAAALLNTRRRFVAVAWAPIVNNIVCISILVWFGLWAGHGASLASVEQHHTQLILLGLGTSLGVVLQGVALVPSLLQADLRRLRWRWNPRDHALRDVARLGAWTLGFVVANQVALFVVTVLAGSVAGPDPVSSYTYAYAFFQLPYGIIAVTVMSVVAPDLAEKWSTDQTEAFLHRMSGGLRAVLALVIPSAVGMLLLAKPAVALLLGIGHSTPAETATTGAALAMFALGLPGFCAYLYFVRVLQSMQRTKVAFFLYLIENALNVVLALALVHPLGVRGLALSLSIAYTVAALLALAVFHQWFGRLAPSETWAPLGRVVIASIPMALVVLLVSNLSGSTSTAGLFVRVVGAVVAGGLTFAAAVIWLGRRHDAARRRPPPPPPPEPPPRPSRPLDTPRIVPYRT